MLLELRIENFAVIERLTVRLGPGLNVLTGETGAGKSIIVGALGLLLGERASSEVVRPGEKRALVEGVFDVAAQPAVAELLAEQGIEAEDGLLILKREVATEGRNRAWVNGAAATAALVGRLGRLLVDLHGQHEHQNLLRADEQRAILDAFAGVAELSDDVAAAHAAWRAAEAELAQLETRRRDVEQRADFLRFQAEEIEAAHLEPAEDERLRAESRRLEHAEELARIAARLHESLYADESSVTAALAAARRDLERLLQIDDGEASARALLESAYYAVEDVGRRLGDYAASVEHDPGRLDALRRRQDLIFRLLRKYGPTIPDALETARAARAELELLDDGGLLRRELEERVGRCRAELTDLAARLSQARRDSAHRLAGDVSAILPELGLAEGSLDVGLDPLDDVGSRGAEAVEFRVTLNRGFEPRPLARVASGGELSRVMLALKTVLARVDAVPSLVFDEVDSGIGGQAAHRVADKLRDVGASHQVFAITHLAQIAARAEQHFRVEKYERDGTTATRVTALSGDARLAELVRMLGGDPASAASLDHARELLGAGALD